MSAFDSVKPLNSWIRCAFDYVCPLFSLKSISYFLDSKYFQVFLMILYIFPEAGLVLFMSLYQWVGIAEITIIDVYVIVILENQGV